MRPIRTASVMVAIAGMLWLWVRLLDADGASQFEARSEVEARRGHE